MLFLAMSFLLLPACGETMSAQEYQQLQQQVSSLKAEVASLQEKLDRSEQDASTSRQEQTQMRAQMTTLEQQLSEAEALLEAQDHDGVVKLLQEANAQIKSLQERLTRMDGTLAIHAAVSFGGAPLVLDQQYTLANGVKLSFTELRYWLTGVTLQKEDGSSVLLPGSYYLMDFMKQQKLENGTPNEIILEAAQRERIQMNAVPAGAYTGIAFNIGVDPHYNDNLSRQTGELTVLKNMASSSWMWFTSYVFTKTKGSYVRADGTSAAFAWETGTNDNLRTVQLRFPSTVTVNAQKQLAIQLNVDATRLFTTYSPNTTPTINASTGAERAQLSNDFASMFSLVSVDNADR